MSGIEKPCVTKCMRNSLLCMPTLESSLITCRRQSPSIRIARCYCMAPAWSCIYLCSLVSWRRMIEKRLPPRARKLMNRLSWSVNTTPGSSGRSTQSRNTHPPLPPLPSSQPVPQTKVGVEEFELQGNVAYSTEKAHDPEYDVCKWLIETISASVYNKYQQTSTTVL